MKKHSRANKGQFFVIAALLVSVVLVSGVISVYSLVRHSTVSETPDVLSAIGEMNSDIKSILDFTVGYYGSILKVTGNSTYAKDLTTSYLSSGLVNIARSHPDWNPSFTLESKKVSARWFMPESSSYGELSISYSLDALGISGVKYETYSALTVEMLPSVSGQAQINVTRDNSDPELGLTLDNFWFYNYTEDATWELVNPTSIVIASNGVYTMDLPAGINPDSYSVQVEDNRGLVVSAFYSPDSVASASGIPHYTYTFDWASTGVENIYNSLSTDTFVFEVLQNGTMKWLGQTLEVVPIERPIPPVAVKAFRINATISGVNQEIPFQIEDWASNYMVPLGLAGNDSIFNNNNLLVFMANNEVSEVTLWWDGNDTAIQTPYAYQNVYFNDNPSVGYLDNGFLELTVHNFYIDSHVKGGSGTYTADFLRISEEGADYGAGVAYVIYNGIVRDIVQQEPEYGGGGVSGVPNFYSQIYVTLPANTPYYTYAARTIFVDSEQSRILDELSVVQLSVLSGTPLTEDGTDGGYPSSDASTAVYYDGYPTSWDHHWSQISTAFNGAGVMLTNADNQYMYVFDNSTHNMGGLNVESNTIEVNPVDLSLSSVPFNTTKDLVWYGAVVSFTTEPLYRTSDDVGLWVMVENPPVLVLDNYISDTDYVDLRSNMDSSPDIGSHTNFMAQKFGPDTVYDTLTEKNTGGTIVTNLIDAESFEGTWPPTSWTETGNWNKESDRRYDGSYSADFDGGSPAQSGYLTSPVMDCSDADEIYVDFWWYDDDLGGGDFSLEFYGSSGWVTIQNLDSSNGWHHYTGTFTGSQYLISNFQIRWSANSLGDWQYVCVDLVNVTKEFVLPDNYEIDLEVRWTNADFDESNEQLCIYVGEASGEDLEVQVWDGSWHTVDTLSVGWNNITVSSYLTSENFVIRFIGADETSDTTQDYWTIDATLLKTWS